MTWNQLVNCLTFEIKRNPDVGNMPALVWLHGDEKYASGEHEVFDVSAFEFSEEVSESNRLSMTVSG